MKIMPLTQGKVAIVDDEDYEFLSKWKWQVHKSGGGNIYAVRTINNKGSKCWMHRLIIEAKKGQLVDHINHDGLDNRQENLRICTPSQNKMNQNPVKNWRGLPKGVTKNKHNGRFKVKLSLNGKGYYFGTFDDLEDAAIMYDVAAQFFFGEYAGCNNLSSHQETLQKIFPTESE